MKVIKTTWFPFGKYDAIALYPFIFIKGKQTDRIVNHEKIHLAQQAELLLLGFYLLYVIFYVWKFLYHAFSNWELSFVQVCDKAYRENPLEVEAYANERNGDYLSNRSRYAWLKKGYV